MNVSTSLRRVQSKWANNTSHEDFGGTIQIKREIILKVCTRYILTKDGTIRNKLYPTNVFFSQSHYYSVRVLTYDYIMKEAYADF